MAKKERHIEVVEVQTTLSFEVAIGGEFFSVDAVYHVDGSIDIKPGNGKRDNFLFRSSTPEMAQIVARLIKAAADYKYKHIEETVPYGD